MTRPWLVGDGSGRLVALVGLVLLWASQTLASAVVCYQPPPVTGTTFVPDNVKSNYTDGDVVVHFCSLTMGFGTVVQRCRVGGQWTAPSRACTDPPPVDIGSAVGLSFATFNGLFVVTVLVRYCIISPSANSRSGGENSNQALDRPV